VRKADNLPPYCAVVTKSGNRNFLEPSGPLQACNGTALHFYILNIISVTIFTIIKFFKNKNFFKKCKILNFPDYAGFA